MRSYLVILAILGCLLVGGVAEPPAPAPQREVDFTRDIQPLFAKHCLQCHGAEQQRSGLRLDRAASAFTGGDLGVAIVPGKSAESRLVRLVTGTGEFRMPPKGPGLSADEIALLRAWIDQGAHWGKEQPAATESVRTAASDWWAFRPIERPHLPVLSAAEAAWCRTPIDLYILAKLNEKGLRPSPEADRPTLIRRLYFDLLGLPPTPEEVAAFVADTDPAAYDKLVEKLLASPHYGERYARHWLDVVHYGDTHGYDKDKPRPNAWPYRDYVIKSLNADKPYGMFIREQVAGDLLRPWEAEGIEALGFLAAGPWDLIGHTELPESKIDGKIARHLDRDNMVTTVMTSVTSLTVQCAQCHNHKFDPIPQRDYYRLQAVFAALDRADRKYYEMPELAQRAAAAESQRTRAQADLQAVRQAIIAAGGEKLAELERRVATARAKAERPVQGEAFGYHSQIESAPDRVKWVQIDLGKPISLRRVELIAAYDDFAAIGAGFGFPSRYKVEGSSDPEFTANVVVLFDGTETDQRNPKRSPVVIPVEDVTVRYIRVTATHLAFRLHDYIFALAEVRALAADGANVARSAKVTALDSLEVPPRWRKDNLVDGQVPSGRNEVAVAELTRWQAELDGYLRRHIPNELLRRSKDLEEQLAAAEKELADLPPPRLAYVGTVHHGVQPFTGTGPTGGKPRAIHILPRGDVRKPGPEVNPGALSLVHALPAEFDLSAHHTEGERRLALARWLTEPRNPLPWRSMVNRVWRWHFGRGIVETTNDFGRMGELPTHPELLDWLAAEFRDQGQSLKQLHRLIVNSATYRQQCRHDSASAATDADNSLYWRMSRRKLEAESLRDSVLAVSGQLDRKLYGPAFQDFVIEKPEHSPHYQYHLSDPEDRRTHRRSIYRFLVRSQQQPLMTALDCADPSMQVDRRNESQSALQALALLNDDFMLCMAKHFAARVAAAAEQPGDQVRYALQLALGRAPTAEELPQLTKHVEEHGLASLCRLLFNLSEFVFID